MSVVGTVAGVAGGIILLGVVAGGGPVRGSDGTVDLGATVARGADVGGSKVGDVVDAGGEGLTRGVVSGVGSSDLAKVAAGGAGVYGGYKAWERWGPGLKVGGPSDDQPPPATTPPPVAQPAPAPPVADPDAPVGEVEPAPGPTVREGITLGGPGAGQWGAWVPCVRGFGTDVLQSSDC